MKQAIYGIGIADVNDFGDWVGYEPVREDAVRALNYHMYLFFWNEYHISQFAEGRKFVTNVKDDSLGKVIGNARILKAIAEYGIPLSMNGYEIGAPACARNTVKPLSRTTGLIPGNAIYTFSNVHYKDMKTDLGFIPDLMARTSTEAMDTLLDSISSVNRNLLYHYPHYFIIGDSRIKVLDDDYQIDG